MNAEPESETWDSALDEEFETESSDPVADDATTSGVPERTPEVERDEYLDALQRLQAEFENYRKRVARQQSDLVARAASDLVAKLLPVLDALDLAEAHLGTDDLSVEGTALVQARSLLVDALIKEGLERIADAGVIFDPLVHDAVAHAPADEGDETTVVDEVLRSGYRWKGNVLRPAMVRVKG